MTALWIAAIVVFGVVEAVTAGLVSIWFVPGAVAGLIAAMAGAGLLIQLVLFLAVSAAALAATRPLVKKLSAGRAVPTNADRVLGRTARVTETIDNDSASGAVYVDGELLEESLDTLERRGEIVREEIAGEQAVYLPQIYEAEVYIAQRIGEMSRSELLPPDDLDKLLKQIQRRQGLTYAPQQRRLWSRPPSGRSCSSPADRVPVRPPASGVCWPSLRPWGWRPPWLPHRTGGQRLGELSLHRGLHQSTACWRPALILTAASWFYTQ